MEKNNTLFIEELKNKIYRSKNGLAIRDLAKDHGLDYKSMESLLSKLGNDYVRNLGRAKDGQIAVVVRATKIDANIIQNSDREQEVEGKEESSEIDFDETVIDENDE